MAAGGSTQQGFRKAFGALKDSTKVGIAKVNSDYKELDVAIVKATNHVELVAKEKHIRTIFEAVSSSRPRADVAYCIHSLAKRLAKTHTWAVALKTLTVIHRALREVDPTFHEELVSYSQSKGLMLNLSHFKDDSSPNAWDYSAWVRSYALYLEERLECFRALKYDVQTDRPRTKELDTEDLIDQLPALQQLLYRLLACQPEGAARYNYLIQYALAIVSAESVKLYVAITDGTLNLVDKFFEMQRHDAVRALEIYRRAGNQAEKLSEFLEICRGLDFGQGQKYIKIEQPPASFMTAMEDYVKEAPQTLTLTWRANNDDIVTTSKAIVGIEPNLETDSKQDVDSDDKPEPSIASPELPKNDQKECVAAPPQVNDLLGFDDDLTQHASELGDKNALALAIFNPENPSSSGNGLDLTSQSSGWELALVTAPSSNTAAVADSKLAGGLDKLTLDSLYDNALARTNQNGGNYGIGQVSTNPFEAARNNMQDPFYASSSIAPPTNVQMANMAQQQQAFMIQHQQQQPVMGHDPTNPFGNPFIDQSAPSYSSQSPYPGLI